MHNIDRYIIYMIHNIRQVPMNINNNPYNVFNFNYFFFKNDSTNIVTAELTQFTIIGAKLIGE